GLWASPFHLVIGITGTYFGLAGIILIVIATLNYGGDRDAVVDQIFTPDPVLVPQEGKPAIGKAFAQMETLAPEKSPIFLTVHEVGEPEQFIEIYAKAPNRMIYAEGYRFDTAGNYIGVAGYENGEWGKQLLWSMYRLHFGDFAGLVSKWLYFVLGVMLTMLCVSGMEIWLSKKAHPPLASRLWYATVWGSVSALAFTAIADMFFTGSLVAVFWCLMLLNTGVTVAVKSLTKPMWLLISGLSVLMLLVAYVAVHGSATFTIASLQLNIPMAVYVIWSVYRARTLIKRASTEQAKVKKDKTGSAGQASQGNSAEGASA
ncbi:MAG TPA: peptidase, partial [Alteromonas mediterranea]|nr:peptidase [Alteromonas mediterranea]